MPQANLSGVSNAQLNKKTKLELLRQKKRMARRHLEQSVKTRSARNIGGLSNFSEDSQKEAQGINEMEDNSPTQRQSRLAQNRKQAKNNANANLKNKEDPNNLESIEKKRKKERQGAKIRRLTIASFIPLLGAVVLMFWQSGNIISKRKAIPVVFRNPFIKNNKPPSPAEIVLGAEISAALYAYHLLFLKIFLIVVIIIIVIGSLGFLGDVILKLFT